ncbi:MAG: hypothetical protein LBI72_06550 [Flavobacteriaceae bacterium]|jgi:hypothetical protein|nr:hypothetical protein [Flavobacteriaceae bacterium]
MKKYTRFNFFKHTYCEWEEVPMTLIEGRKPDYKSKTGSAYYFDEEGVIRYSNHWGRAANCRWKLISETKKNNVYCLAYARWDSFFPNNEDQALFAIIVEDDGSIGFKHKGVLGQTNAIYRTAKETSSRIKKIKELQTTTAWFKYVEGIELDEARTQLIQGLIETNLSVAELKKQFF